MNRDICLGRPPVHIATGQGKALPSCAYWPHCVRPADYYQRAYPVERRRIEKDGVPTFTVRDYSGAARGGGPGCNRGGGNFPVWRCQW